MTRYTPTTITDATLPSAHNQNYSDIETAIDSMLDRNGEDPNQMNDILDMNSYRIINTLDPVMGGDVATKDYVDDLALGGSVCSCTTDYLTLTDGVTPPDADPGLAYIYIDESDGDLKIIFEDSEIINISDAGYTHPNHSGDVTSTGDGAQVLASVAITGQTPVTADSADYVLISDTSDSGSLKKSLISDIEAAVTYTHPNHSGDVVSVADGAQTLASVAITGQTAVIPTTVDYLLISDTSDSGALKKVLVSDVITVSSYTHPNHSGDVTSVGDGAQTLASVAISGQSTVEATSADYILIGDTSDSDNLKKSLISDIVALAGGAGKQTIWIPSGAIRPTVSNGCAPLVDVETTAGSPDMTVLDFDWLADEHGQFQIDYPKAWDAGTLSFRAEWTHVGAVSTGVAIGLQAIAIGDGESIDQAFSGGTPVVVTDDAQGTANALEITVESDAMTVGGTPTDDKMIYFRIYRDVSNVNDDMLEDMRLKGIQLYYTTSASSDE